MKRVKNSIKFATGIRRLDAMVDNHILNYFNEREKEFLLRLGNLKTSPEAEDIHQLRVEVKKIRSVLQLLDHIPGNTFEHKAFRKMLRQLFRPAGRVREEQINLNLAEGLEGFSLSGYRGYLQMRIDKQSGKLMRALNRFDENSFREFNSAIKTEIGLFDEKTLRDYAGRFMQKQLSLVRRTGKEMQQKNQIHETRKHLKALRYILNIALEWDHNEETGRFYILVKDTETLIGNWHDLEMLNRSLKKFGTKPDGYNDQDEINRVTAKLENEQSDLLALIQKNLDSMPEKIKGFQGNSEISNTY
ncbi:MAG: CHAD domain-containing protein [Chlorobi bacterium]|nr:CHAD domain-containing protein [Chlorobiota bacterium]